MIRRLKYIEIDFEKYTECVEQSVQYNFYARKEILNFLTHNSWELLVEGDYNAVMPIPVKKKWGIVYVYMPLFCQQLGVFSKTENGTLVSEFLNYLNQNYRVQGYFFNQKNNLNTILQVRKNYCIPISEYPLLRKKYFKGRKSTVKSAQNFTLERFDFSDLITQFIQDNFKGLACQKDVERYLSYLNFLNIQNRLVIYGAVNPEKKLCNIAILIDNEKEFLLLGLINNEKYLKQNGASFLIDQLIQKYISTKSLNMMGGSIRGIEVFFKSFGAECEEYPYIFNTKWDFLKNIIKF